MNKRVIQPEESLNVIIFYLNRGFSVPNFYSDFKQTTQIWTSIQNVNEGLVALNEINSKGKTEKKISIKHIYDSMEVLTKTLDKGCSIPKFYTDLNQPMAVLSSLQNIGQSLKTLSEKIEPEKVTKYI